MNLNELKQSLEKLEAALDTLEDVLSAAESVCDEWEDHFRERCEDSVYMEEDSAYQRDFDDLNKAVKKLREVVNDAK